MMITSFYSLLQCIQYVLLTLSGSLLTGVLVAPYWKSRVLRDGRTSLHGGDGLFRVAPAEKRRARRMPSESLFDLEVDAGRYDPRSARVLNISNTGACVTGALTMKMRGLIRGRIVSNGQGPLRVAGRVVWSKKLTDRMLYGLQFDSLLPINGQSLPVQESR